MGKIKLVCCGNFMNHYTLALSEELDKCFDNYHYIVSNQLPKEREKMGFSDLNNNSFVIKAYEDKEKARLEILNADVVITGSYKYMEHINERRKLGKTTFFDSERLYKYNRFFNKISAIKNFLQYSQYNDSLLLCVSAYAADDYNSAGIFKGRTYKWGYFPKPFVYDNVEKIIKNKIKNSIIWAGRLISWKHPEYVIEVANKLKQNGYNFSVNIIGNGDMKEELKNQIQKYKLEKNVHLLGSMSPDKVRKYMEEAQIYLFTSDKGEGWGVVLNEAMNSACAVIASYSTGSSPYLIEDNKNGLVYYNDNLNELYEKTKYLLDNNTKISQYGLQGYKTITNDWNPKNAAKRLHKFCNAYLNSDNYQDLFKNGILSKTKI